MATAVQTPTYRKSWREKVSLSAYLTALIMIAISLISVILSYYVFNILKENKYRDITSIMFLELEKHAHMIKQKLDIYENELLIQTKYLTNLSSATVVLGVMEDGKSLSLVRGEFPDEIALKDFGLKRIEDIQQVHLLQFRGKSYFAKLLATEDGQSRLLYLWKINLGKLAGLNERISKESEVYILSREFKVIYRNSPAIKEEGLIDRKLIQQFIGSSIRKGQFHFRKADGNYYGFYAEIPGTNVVLFSETTEDVITGRIFDLFKNLGMGVGLIILVSILLVQLIIPSITGPLKELVQNARVIAKGKFRLNTRLRGFGEVNELMRAFARMGSDLENRDQEIMTLMRDKQERVRLDQELLIAKKIQENFLPHTMDISKDGIHIASFYQPAEEVAGDWYQQFLDERTGEFIAIIADVSGHGAGSSMFTAVIAAQFEEFKIMRSEQYTIYSFIQNLNKIFRQLGRGNWHATLLVAIVAEDRKHITFINSGHPFPLIVQKEGNQLKATSVKMPSTPVGLEDLVQCSEVTIPIQRDVNVLFFTDGIIEVENLQSKPFGRKRITSALETSSNFNPQHVIDHVHKVWTKYIKGNKPKDDICLYSMEVRV